MLIAVAVLLIPIIGWYIIPSNLWLMIGGIPGMVAAWWAFFGFLKKYNKVFDEYRTEVENTYNLNLTKEQNYNLFYHIVYKDNVMVDNHSVQRIVNITDSSLPGAETITPLMANMTTDNQVVLMVDKNTPYR